VEPAGGDAFAQPSVLPTLPVEHRLAEHDEELEWIWYEGVKSATRPDEVEKYCKKVIDQAKLGINEAHRVRPQPPAADIIRKEVLSPKLDAALKQANLSAFVDDMIGDKVSMVTNREDADIKSTAVLAAKTIMRLVPETKHIRFGYVEEHGFETRVDLTDKDLEEIESGRLKPSSLKTATEWVGGENSDACYESSHWYYALSACEILADCGRKTAALKLFDELVKATGEHPSRFYLYEVPKLKEDRLLKR